MCGNEEFEKAVAEIQHGTYHDGACPLWIEMFGRARAEQRGSPSGQGVFFVVKVLARAIKHILLAWTGENSCCGVDAS